MFFNDPVLGIVLKKRSALCVRLCHVARLDCMSLMAAKYSAAPVFCDLSSPQFPHLV